MGPSGLTGTGQCKTQFVALVERYCQLGRLLPALDGIDTDDNVELAEFVGDKEPVSAALLESLLSRDIVAWSKKPVARAPHRDR